ncbi:MAG: flagellar biosynthetic protein FliO [Oligoflexia bacterium]|nr:flagellar biosynthetic protein FliO [Oligoflexia bacterium]
MKYFVCCLTCLLLALPARAEETSTLSNAEQKLARTRQMVQEQGEGLRPAAWKPGLAPEQDSIGTAAFKMVKGLGLCIGALLIALHLYRRKHPSSAAAVGRQLRIIERLPINTKTSLVMAEIAGKRVVLAVGADRVSTVVHDVDAPSSEEMIELPMEYVCAEEPQRSVA